MRLTVVRQVSGRAWIYGDDVRVPLAVVVNGAPAGALVVSNDATGVSGVGADLPSAIADFRAALVEHRDVLERSQPLSVDLAGQLALLRRHLRP